MIKLVRVVNAAITAMNAILPEVDFNIFSITSPSGDVESVAENLIPFASIIWIRFKGSPDLGLSAGFSQLPSRNLHVAFVIKTFHEKP